MKWFKKISACGSRAEEKEKIMSTFNVGDVVKLTSGGVKMTVKGTIGKNELPDPLEKALIVKGAKEGDVICEWTEPGILKQNVNESSVLMFANEELTKFNGDK